MATMELHSLRHRKVNSTGTDLSPASPPAFSNVSIVPASYLPPSPTYPEYKTYSVHNLDCLNITLHADRYGPALYTVINSTFTRGPSVTLHVGPRTNSAIGAAHLSAWSGTNRFGICSAGVSPGAIEGVEGMVWEELWRVSTWTHSTYAFEWAWADGERRKYEWRRTSSPLRFGDQSDHELVEMGRDGVVLAQYLCGDYIRWTVRGSLEVRFLMAEGEEEWRKWETVVVLTAMSLLELERRRSRARKKV